ncbi:hypothetical protein B0H10DRAFT_1991801 [Mycena sp. CBHHK59/15]|nr:hypothetical protein B0H10DRAFT_1991801 [Mycena sp. CBHHK59/15]
MKEALADSLYNLGVHLSAAGRNDDALIATEEAVTLRRELSEADPGMKKSVY